VLLPSDR